MLELPLLSPKGIAIASGHYNMRPLMNYRYSLGNTIVSGALRTPAKVGIADQ